MKNQLLFPRDGDGGRVLVVLPGASWVTTRTRTRCFTARKAGLQRHGWQQRHRGNERRRRLDHRDAPGRPGGDVRHRHTIVCVQQPTTSRTNLAVHNGGTAPTITWDGTDGSPTAMAGSLKVTAPYSGANQYVDIQSPTSDDHAGELDGRKASRAHQGGHRIDVRGADRAVRRHDVRQFVFVGTSPTSSRAAAGRSTRSTLDIPMTGSPATTASR